MDEKKRQILELLTAAFATYPQLRAGQIIANLFEDSDYEDDLFYIGDATLIERLNKYLKGESHG